MRWTTRSAILATLVSVCGILAPGSPAAPFGPAANNTLTPILVQGPLALTLDRSAYFDGIYGAVAVTGTLSCRSGTFLQGPFPFPVTLSQPVGAEQPMTGVGFPTVGLPSCDGRLRPWSVRVQPAAAHRFVPGPATAVVTFTACAGFCQTRRVTGTVTVGPEPAGVRRFWSRSRSAWSVRRSGRWTRWVRLEPGSCTSGRWAHCSWSRVRTWCAPRRVPPVGAGRRSLRHPACSAARPTEFRAAPHPDGTT